jgi:septal ring factor EnvC (AmiA/AmiB activator)
LQVALNKIPAYITKLTKQLARTEADIEKVNNKIIEIKRKEEQSRQWQSQGLCRHDGGKIGGLFVKKCKSCGMKA